MRLYFHLLLTACVATNPEVPPRATLRDALVVWSSNDFVEDTEWSYSDQFVRNLLRLVNEYPEHVWLEFIKSADQEDFCANTLKRNLAEKLTEGNRAHVEKVLDFVSNMGTDMLKFMKSEGARGWIEQPNLNVDLIKRAFLLLEGFDERPLSDQDETPVVAMHLCLPNFLGENQSCQNNDEDACMKLRHRINSTNMYRAISLQFLVGSDDEYIERIFGTDPAALPREWLKSFAGENLVNVYNSLLAYSKSRMSSLTLRFDLVSYATTFEKCELSSQHAGSGLSGTHLQDLSNLTKDELFCSLNAKPDWKSDREGLIDEVGNQDPFLAAILNLLDELSHSDRNRLLIDQGFYERLLLESPLTLLHRFVAMTPVRRSERGSLAAYVKVVDKCLSTSGCLESARAFTWDLVSSSVRSCLDHHEQQDCSDLLGWAELNPHVPATLFMKLPPAEYFEIVKSTDYLSKDQFLENVARLQEKDLLRSFIAQWDSQQVSLIKPIMDVIP